ncbi:MAG: hypothetical protein HF978_17335 [Desulfobacteraceae bacterium]|nr:hypothetical protein [Desulfobacteraceae bacterium]MBC2757309.1 hypothetical protein [Desulfobacteraceae bacterium]
MSVIDSLKTTAYTAFFNIGKRLQSADKPMKSDVEGVHPPKTGNPKYNESFYFNFFNNKKDDIGCFTWIGKLPNQKAINGKHLFFVGREEGLVKFDYDGYPEHTNKFQCRDTYYEVIEPFKKIHIVSKGKALRLTKPSEVSDLESIYREKIFGLKNPYEVSASDLENLYREFEKNNEEIFVPIEMNCIFTASSPAHNSKNHYARGLAKQVVENGFGISDLKNLRKIAAEHYEQAGSYKGTLKIGSRTIEIDAIGHRDHSWGVRDWHAPEKWTWLSVEFGDGVGLNLCRIVIGRVDMFLGYIIREGRNFPLKEYMLDTEFELDGMTQKKLHFRIEDVGGFRMNVTGRVFNVFHLTFKEDEKHTIINEGLTEYSWEGKKSFGISEYLHRLS